MIFLFILCINIEKHVYAIKIGGRIRIGTFSLEFNIFNKYNYFQFCLKITPFNASEFITAD